MSAAAPYPSPSPGGGGGVGASNGSSAPQTSFGHGGERAYEHIQDLRLKALSGFDRQGTVHHLLGDADRALNQARTLLEFRRPDMSYVEYLRASEIVVEALPHNKGWPDFQMDHGGGGMQKYQLLQKRINAQAEQYGKIKDIIIHNNMRSGVQPASAGNGGNVRTESPSRVNGNGVNGVKIKPAPSPKPESLHGRAISPANLSGAQSNPAAVDPLRDRLAALRNGNAIIDTNRPESRSSNPSSVHSSPITMPNASDYGSRSSFETFPSAFSKSSFGPTSRPQGPRGMPNGNAGPPIPGKLPLDTSIGVMPQEPKATYSPARNMQTTGNIELPRHTPRSLASTNSRRTSLVPASSASSYAPNTADSGDYFPTPTRTLTNGSTSSQASSQVPRRKSVHVPKETRISAERLYDYLERFYILLIDFRSRQDFDQGHIYSRNIMCVDPIHITQGMSAEQLLDRMVISPEIEQEMYMNRDKYDLVVYYDTQTQSETFLSKPMGELQTKLKYLHEALYDFNLDKPLQRPPIVLIGGIDAWADLVGNQALATSDTASRVKQGRPIQRRPVGSGQLRNPKRRLREYNPLDPEEEQKWRERARAESVHLPTPINLGGAGEEVIQEEPDEDMPDSAIINEFNERFPEAGALDRYAFGPLQPTRAAPEPPPKVPMYPTAPRASMYPTVPARPAPAAPRTSYTGVSDRAGSQNVPAARSMSMVPYIPAKYMMDNYRLPRTGLVNFRFTCYMNAVLQALSHTKPLSLYFILDDYRKQVQINWKGSKGIMPDIYANLIKSLWKDDVSCIRPTSFRKFCGELEKQWINDRQEQDAKEFLEFLVDCLHEDLNFQHSREVLRAMTKKEEARREQMPRPLVARLEWDRFTHRSQSFVNTVFGGQYASRLCFETCGHTSTTHDAFFQLSVEIPNMRYPTLDDCMRSFTRVEKLDPEERAKCDQCNERRDSTKQLTITRAPQFLVVHFKRFFKRPGRDALKIPTAINFPLDGFDLEPYMLKQYEPSAAEAEAIARDFGPDYAKPDPSMTPPYKYDAYAVIRHHGSTIESGHYTTLVKDKNRGKWRCFNDDKHNDFVPGEGPWRGDGDIRNGQAYIVFYQRTMPSPLGPGGRGKF